jgi:2-succinyl-5-enolpyruvyl-6-hydroxy-3-cyclohexene-1-carboxylate synthase
MAADAAVRRAADEAVAAETFPSEPAVVRAVVDALPDGASLWAASSMPVRDLDMVLPASTRDLRFAANRGANGIDGFLSAGLGAAAAGTRPTYLLAGDLSVLVDATALAAAARLGVPATIVAIDNDGGGIFHFLPQHGGTPHFERHFGTPHGLDLTTVAEAFGVQAITASSAEQVAGAVAEIPSRPQLIAVHTERDENVAVHRRIRAAARRALD